MSTATVTPPPVGNAIAGETTSYDRINDYGAVRISLASPHDIRSWSFGEVKKPETINYRTYRPEKDGLFCEKIFGPEKDWECTCGKYRGMKYKGMICDRCGVKVTHSRVRRKRMGHIELAAPVVHIWFFKAMPSRLGTLLDMKTTSLEKIVYFQDYVVVDAGQTKLKERQLLTEDEYRRAVEEYGPDAFEADMGAEAIKKLLEKLNLVDVSADLRDKLQKENEKGDKASKARQKDYVKRLKIIESLRDSSNKPEWMVLECIPVIPPDLRPLVLLDSGNFATSDLNDLYRRIINRNNRLKKLVDLNAPEVIIRNEKRMLQQSVDALFDNNRCKRPVLGSSNRPLKSLTDMIKGKQGRFRENLLGKRVDYSARSVIVVGPELKLHQCGLPKKIALELFQPFIIRRLKELGLADTIKSAKKMLERKDDHVWDILEEVTKSHPVLLNRAPTLHRMGIQAFEPVLIEGNAIRIHPLVCKGFNADFDGDQMAVHLPLSIEAQVEAHVLMMSTNNIFSPANGNPIITPSQDIVMGCYYLTAARGEEGERIEAGDGMTFHSPQELFSAFQLGKLGVHAKVRVRLPIEKKFITEIKTDKGAVVEELPRKANGLVLTTVGRVVFNDILHPKMAFYDLSLSSKHLSRIIADCYQILGRKETIDLLDRMKETGFRESTRSGLSFAASDLRTPANKDAILKDKDKEVEKLRKQFERGFITEAERYNKVLEQWGEAREKITGMLMEALKHDRRKDLQTGKEVPYLNPIFLMANSGARGGVEQIRQLAGLRGLMAKPSGEIIETPIKSNFREGLTVLEYFSSTHGARKGLADTALKTADSGYLTRKLADVAQNVVITMHDCGTTQGITKGVIYKGDEVDRSLAEGVRGRVSRNEIRDPKAREPIVEENEMITPASGKTMERLGLDKISVRSPMTCQAPLGVCRLCYGMDLATGALVEEGMAVGIIAAQSIGEPGTQLTMRTFHIGGVAKGNTADSDRKTRKGGIVALERITPVVHEQTDAAGHKTRRTLALTRTGEILIYKDRHQPPIERFSVPNGAEMFVKDGQEVKPGERLCQWDPHMTPIIAEEGGKVRFEDLKENETYRKEKDAGGAERYIIMEHKGDLHPSIVIEDARGNILKAYFIPERAYLEVRNGEEVSAGHILAKTPKEASGNQDIVGGLPRVTEIFEARTPRDSAVMAKVNGKIRVGERKRGKRQIFIQPEDDKGRSIGDEVLHEVPHGKQLRVSAGDYIKAGDALIVGPLKPHDILDITGAEMLQEYLVREVQSVYRSQRVEIDDKHIEIIVSQMLRKVKIKDMGDTNLLPGSVMDKFAFMAVNDRLMNECVKIKGKGESSFEVGKIVIRDAYDEECARIEVEGGKKPTWEAPTPATSEVVLLGITKAAVQSESFISAASFQETTKVLTEAALAGKADYLVGLKENVILGHLVPAGTGFNVHQNSEVRINAPEGEGEAVETPDETLVATPA
ncbi:MAG TPA: DNA-directed RNA polymerase subunit beta' [Gemmataceae bacterium]|jgi:DNA-directed RNA polymerase subunit beta'|nr:DNA-directed RNA polymerase subunit beta' [Gemmataceae bacterium]